MVAPIIAQGKIDQIATWNRPDGTSIPHVCGFTVNTLAQAYLYAVEKMQGSGVAIGTDFNGFAGLPGPVGGPEACPGGKAAGPHLLGLTYPFIATVTGVALDRSQIGQKNYDINDDGLAHVGMLPDLIANLSALGVTEKELDPLLNSADYYIALWNRAVLRTDLYFIKTAHTPSGNVEVHSDGAASNFQQRTLDAASDFSHLDGANGVWQMAAP